MTDQQRKFEPFTHKLGRVVKPPTEREFNGKTYVDFPISVQRTYEANDTDWVTVHVERNERPAAQKRADQALSLVKGDRVVVEGNYRVKQGTGKEFYDLYATALYKAVEITVDEDDEL